MSSREVTPAQREAVKRYDDACDALREGRTGDQWWKAIEEPWAVLCAELGMTPADAAMVCYTARGVR